MTGRQKLGTRTVAEELDSTENECGVSRIAPRDLAIGVMLNVEVGRFDGKSHAETFSITSRDSCLLGRTIESSY